MKKWKVNTPDNETASKISVSCGVSSLTASAFVAKGFLSPDSVMHNFNIDGLSDPFLIKDMQAAVDTINNAIDNDERICVYGDYDCDGIMASVILYTYLRECGANVTYYIPERSEGYGLNNNAVEKICNDGVKLIVTVDNGISAISEAEYIYSLGMKLVVTDHHQQSENLPKAEAVVDPHRSDCFSPFKYMCGAGIALKLVAAMNDGDYTFALEQFGDLAAIATVADIVSLTDENRFIVAYGLERINNTDRPSLIALKQVSKLAGRKVDSTAVGFRLAPKINAAGRSGSPETAMKLFLCDDYDTALELAEELELLNNERKKNEQEILSEIYDMINENPMLVRDRVIFICGKNWSHGVIGIVAARVMEIFGKPCFIASDIDNEIRGSARSFGNFSVFQALTYAENALEKFGGHMGAGGFTVKNGMADDFRRLLNEYAMKNHHVMPVYEITADVSVKPYELTVENIRGLDVLEPCGTGNEKPTFFFENARIINVIPISNGSYTKIRIQFGNVQTEALAFRIPYERFAFKSGDSCDIIANLSVNEFMERVTINLNVIDIRQHSFSQDKYFAALNTFEAFIRNEKIPDNYYAAMLPTRDQTAFIYRNIPKNGIVADNLYIRIADSKINYCRFCVAVEAMKQLGLVTVSYDDSMIKRVENPPRTDINSAPILIALRNSIQKK